MKTYRIFFEGKEVEVKANRIDSEQLSGSGFKLSFYRDEEPVATFGCVSAFVVLEDGL